MIAGLRFWFFGAVAGTSLFAVLYALRVENTANNMIAYTREVLHSASTDHHYTVFLQIVSFSRNIGVNFDMVGQANLGEFSQGRVRFLGSHGADLDADAAFEGAGVLDLTVFQSVESGEQSRGFAFLDFRFAGFSD